PPGGMVWYSDRCGDANTWSLASLCIAGSCTPGSFGGREVHSVNADPSNNSDVYVVIDTEGTSTDPLGLWQSTDGGVSFNHVAHRIPIDLVFPTGNNNLFGEADDGGEPLLAWDKTNPNQHEMLSPTPYPSDSPAWDGPGGGIALTAEQNIFEETYANHARWGLWYFSPPLYNVPFLLEDIAPPIRTISVSAPNGTVTVTTLEPHLIQSGDEISIQARCAPNQPPPCIGGLNMNDANGSPTFI